MENELVLYSTNTFLAYKISEVYYLNVHYVWCSPYFDINKQEDLNRINPPSSNPYDIYMNYKQDIERKDRHSTRIRENRFGILKGANYKKKCGIISEAQYEEILDIVNAAQFEDFKPLMYIIPVSLVVNLAKYAPVKLRANAFSYEYIIQDLPRNYFDIIEF